MSGLIHTWENFWQLFQPNNQNLSQNVIQEISYKEKDIVSLQRKYMNLVDSYYKNYPPFAKNKNLTLEQKVKIDTDCYFTLIKQSMYCNDTLLLHRWGIDYIQKPDVILAKPRSFYSQRFELFSNSNKANELNIGVTASFYFRYLFENFPKD